MLVHLLSPNEKKYFAHTLKHKNPRNTKVRLMKKRLELVEYLPELFNEIRLLTDIKKDSTRDLIKLQLLKVLQGESFITLLSETNIEEREKIIQSLIDSTELNLSLLNKTKQRKLKKNLAKGLIKPLTIFKLAPKNVKMTIKDSLEIKRRLPKKSLNGMSEKKIKNVIEEYFESKSETEKERRKIMSFFTKWKRKKRRRLILFLERINQEGNFNYTQYTILQGQQQRINRMVKFGLLEKKGKYDYILTPFGKEIITTVISFSKRPIASLHA